MSNIAALAGYAAPGFEAVRETFAENFRSRGEPTYGAAFATNGPAAMTLALAHSRGWLDYDDRVCTYWPAFAQSGKERLTVRQLLGHQAGLFALDEPVDRALLTDFERLARVLARQKPAWEPGPA